MSDNNNFVKIDFNDIFWGIFVEDTGRKNGNKEDSEPIIELKWGWTANCTKEEIAEMESSSDCPTGYESVKILKCQAIKLRDDLNEIILSLDK